MTDEEVNELRIYAMSMQHLEPVLRKKKDTAVVQLLQKYNQGEDTARATAKLAALTEIVSEIQSKLKKFESLSTRSK